MEDVCAPEEARGFLVLDIQGLVLSMRPGRRTRLFLWTLDGEEHLTKNHQWISVSVSSGPFTRCLSMGNSVWSWATLLPSVSSVQLVREVVWSDGGSQGIRTSTESEWRGWWMDQGTKD